jgi:hypothetical protein
MLRNCTSARYELNKSRMVPIAEYSRDLLRELRRKAGIAYDERARGLLQLFRYQRQLDGTGKDIAILDRFRVPYELLDVEGCIRAEPALRLVREKFVGGLRLLGDETGDCFKFTQTLAKLAEGLGVAFRFGVAIERLLGAGAIMVAIVGYAIGPMVVKHRLADVEPLGPVAGALDLGNSFDGDSDGSLRSASRRPSGCRMARRSDRPERGLAGSRAGQWTPAQATAQRGPGTSTAPDPPGPSTSRGWVHGRSSGPSIFVAPAPATVRVRIEVR